MIQFYKIYILHKQKIYNIFFFISFHKKVIISFFNLFIADDSYILKILILCITADYYNNLLK